MSIKPRKTITINLSEQSCQIESREVTVQSDYGRGLAVQLLKQHTKPETDRLDADNPLIFVPGFFVGNGAPSACRMSVVSKRDASGGVHISNITGDMPQRLASLGIEALVIHGKAEQPGTVLVLEDDKVSFLTMPELVGQTIPQVIATLRGQFGDECSITGTGPSADSCLPLGSLFTTYPKGTPPYSCPRNSFGDVAGSKNLKAIVIRHSAMFGADCHDKASFQRLAAQLSHIIRQNDICGGALPGYGSITLMKLLKSRDNIPVVPPAKAVRETDENGNRINRTCSPVCVIGCLNRGEHQGTVEGFFDVPEVSEVSAALAGCFDLHDFELVQRIMVKSFEIGLNATEFVFTANLYAKAVWGREKKVTPDDIYGLLLEVEKLSLAGRVIGGGSSGVYRLYRDQKDLAPLVTKPSIKQEKDFAVSLLRPEGVSHEIGDMDLLYREIFLLENLGICIFTSFALLNNFEALELLAQMMEAKTGYPQSLVALLDYAGDCIKEERRYHEENALDNIEKSIPEFTKVLYRYFMR